MLSLIRKCSVLLVLALLITPAGALCAKKTEILVGTHVPLTGMLSAVGHEQKWAYEQAVRDINDNGGIYVRRFNAKLPVRLIILDDGTNPGLAASAVEYLICEEKVDMILSGHTAVFGVIPGCLVAEKYKTYYHATACFAPTWLEHRFKYSTLMFYDITQGLSLPFKIWQTMPLNQRPGNIGILVEDTFEARGLVGYLHESINKAGYHSSLEEYWVLENDNFKEKIEALKAADIDTLFLFGTNSDSINLVRQLKAAQLPLKYIYCWRGAWVHAFWEKLGADAQYIMFDALWSAEYGYPGAKDLGQKFEDEFGYQSVSIGCFYAAAQVLFQAVEYAGSLDSAKIRQATLRYTFDTVIGPIKYNEHGVGLFESAAFQWIDGRQTLIYPFNLAQGQAQMLVQP